jgi:hypothetical protein
MQKKNGRSIQQTRTSRRQTLRTQRWNGNKGKTEELLVKQLKTCEKKMQ